MSAFFTKLAKLSTISTLAGASTFHILTRNCTISTNHLDISKDYPFISPSFEKLNPNGNKPVFDDCVRRVKVRDIKPELLDTEKKPTGELVKAYCAGVFAGRGYALQRRILEHIYRSDLTTQHELWDPSDLLAADFEVGTQITHHMEVVDSSATRIIFRAGDESCSNSGIRPIEGMAELSVEFKKDETARARASGEDIVEFHFKMAGWLGTLEDDGKPLIPWYMVWLHQQYTKVLVENAMGNVRLPLMDRLKNLFRASPTSQPWREERINV